MGRLGLGSAGGGGAPPSASGSGRAGLVPPYVVRARSWLARTGRPRLEGDRLGWPGGERQPAGTRPKTSPILDNNAPEADALTRPGHDGPSEQQLCLVHTARTQQNKSIISTIICPLPRAAHSHGGPETTQAGSASAGLASFFARASGL